MKLLLWTKLFSAYLAHKLLTHAGAVSRKRQTYEALNSGQLYDKKVPISQPIPLGGVDKAASAVFSNTSRVFIV